MERAPSTNTSPNLNQLTGEASAYECGQHDAACDLKDFSQYRSAIMGRVARSRTLKSGHEPTRPVSVVSWCSSAMRPQASARSPDRAA